MKNIFLIIILLHFHFINLALIPFNDIWNLEFNNGKEIELFPGVLTQITIQLTSNENNNIYEENEFYKIYKLSISDDNKEIISSTPDLIISPNQTSSYSFYIGLKCQKYLKKDYTLKFNTYYSTYLNKTNFTRLDKEIKLNLKIKDEKKKINILPVMKKMPGNSVNFFKLKNEIYNIDKIVIKPKNNEKLIINDIIIEPFLNRDELSEENSANHGILFDYSFGIENLLEKKTEYKFELYIEKDNEDICYELETKIDDLKIEITEDGPITLNENAKKAILFNIEDQTEKYEVTNSIKIKTKIETFPSILTCNFIPSYSNLGYSSKNNDAQIFKSFITKVEDHFNIIVNNLEANTEYYSYCELSSTDYNEKERSKIKIDIGNFETADKIIKLFPSIDENRIPHCVKFEFQNEVTKKRNLFKFSLFGLAKCYLNMKKDEPLFAKGLPTIFCQTTEITSKYSTFCTAPLPLYNLGKYLTIKERDKFSKKFDEFINDVKRYSIFLGITLKDKYEKIIDTDINQNSIKASFINSTNNDDILNINFNVLSTHSQPVQCFYNYDLSNNCRYSLLENSINLSPNEKQIINVKITDPTENIMYTLNFKCYNNLPHFKLRYKTTGIMNMFTYYHTDNDNSDSEEDEINTNTIINCNLKKNLFNPRCLKDKIISVVDKLTTDLPPFFKELENKAEQFSKMLPKVQNQYLDKLNNDFSQPNNNKTYMLEKVLEFTKYLTYLDCSIYSSGSSNKEEDTIKSQKYTECRQRKQNYLEKMVNTLRNKIQILDCSFINNIITSELVGDIEINLKYILILINELSNNPESYKKGLSSILLDTTICIQENFENYWEKVETQKRKSNEYLNTTISAIKKDVIYIMIQTLTNLAKVIHFDEIDGYIDAEKTKTGLILNEKYIKIQNKIIDFSRKLNEFGEESYDLSGSTFSIIEKNKGLNSSYDDVIKTINITNKNIILRIYSNYMLRINNADSMQILVFDSPLVSIKESEDKEKYSDSVNTFISIVLYNKKWEEIPITFIDENHRPEILYLKSQYDELKKCFYFDNGKKELEGEGVLIDENYEYNEQKYIKCASSHLTAFTAGTYNFNSDIPWWVVLLIISCILVVLLTMIIIFIVVKKKNNRKKRISYSNINSEFNKKDVLLEE